MTEKQRTSVSDPTDRLSAVFKKSSQCLAGLLYVVGLEIIQNTEGRILAAVENQC